MHTVTHIWQSAAAVLKQFDIDTPLLDARLLVQHVLGITREELLMNPKREMSEAEQQAFEALLARRLEREPMSHILGKREFYGLEFKVTGDVLTPRPDSETVIDAVLEWVTTNKQKNKKEIVLYPLLSPFRVLDLGTGSGCLLLTLLHKLTNAHGMGVDISSQALAIAQENAESLSLTDRVEFQVSNWCEKLTGQYQIVVANPPYIASNAIAALMPEVAQFDPLSALDGGADGLACYRDIALQLPPYMAEDAILAVEIGAGQEVAIAEIFKTQGFSVLRYVNDLAGIIRCLVMNRQ